MELIVVILFAVLTAVLCLGFIAALIRLIGECKALKEDRNRCEIPPVRVAVIKQKEGEVRIAYFVDRAITPDGGKT